jgi:hypothetical protein
MNQQLKENKQIIRNFLREHYTDEKLVMLLAHAQSGKLSFHSCCCFIGIPTADHALQGKNVIGYESHYKISEMLSGAGRAEEAYARLDYPIATDEERRRRRLISIVKAEIRRRDRLAQSARQESAKGSNHLSHEYAFVD